MLVSINRDGERVGAEPLYVLQSKLKFVPGHFGLPSNHCRKLVQDLYADSSAFSNQLLRVVGPRVVLDDGVYKDVRVEKHLIAHSLPHGQKRIREEKVASACADFPRRAGGFDRGLPQTRACRRLESQRCHPLSISARQPPLLAVGWRGCFPILKPA